MGRVSNRKNVQKHEPLMESNVVSKKQQYRHGNKKEAITSDAEDDNEKEAYIDSKHTKKILDLAKKQQQEIFMEENGGITMEEAAARQQQQQNEEEEEDNDDEESEFEEDYIEYNDELEDFENEYAEVDPEEARILEEYLNKSDKTRETPGLSLADKIMNSIREKEQQQNTSLSSTGMVMDTSEERGEGVALPPKIIKAYSIIQQILTTWTHGKLPKLFKILPSLKNWQDILYVLQPETWTPHVTYEATKLFVSNLGPKEAAKFLNLVLLPKFLQEVEDREKHDVSYHTYRAMRKSLYKPAAFFKGFLFPLLEQENCNAREALLVGSVLSKVSVPVLHSSAALSWLLSSDREMTNANMVFIRVLLEKRYALPYQVIDECVFYFMKFRNVLDGQEIDEKSETLPLVWHKAFLSFATRYKNDITQDQRDFLLEVLRQRGHKDIAKEIRKELLAGVSREFESTISNTQGDIELEN
ncbi:hypothetical protein ACO0SA_001087 [Hanseniaspora valbyensis]